MKSNKFKHDQGSFIKSMTYLILGFVFLFPFKMASQSNSASLTQLEEEPSIVEVFKEDLVLGESLYFKSQILNEDRKLNIYLPAEYNKDSLTRYPVIYLLDGSLDEDFIHVAGLMQFACFPWIQMMPNSILVGIENVDRKRDFTYPTSNKQDAEAIPTSGHSEEFVEFLKKEVMPKIEHLYPCTDERMIIGQSLGGLLAAEILYTEPALFNHYMIVSPSLWWDDESLLKRELSIPKETAVYIAVGEEGEVMVRVAKELRAKVEEAIGEESTIDFKYFPECNHADVLHKAVYHGLGVFYPIEEE